MRDAAAMIHSLWDALQKVYRKHLVCGTHAYIHVARHPKSALLLRIFFDTSTYRACGDGNGQLSVLNETLLGRARSIAGLNKHQIITITRHDDTTSSLRFVLLASDRCRCIGAKASPLSRHHVGVAGTPALMPPPAKHARCQATQCGKINAIRQSLH